MNLQQKDNSIAHHSWWMLLHYLVKKIAVNFQRFLEKRPGSVFEDSFNKTRQNNIFFSGHGVFTSLFTLCALQVTILLLLLATAPQTFDHNAASTQHNKLCKGNIFTS